MTHSQEDRIEDARILSGIVAALPLMRQAHAPDSPLYGKIGRAARRCVESLFSDPQGIPVPFAPFGELVFPYVRMGVIDSLNLFDLDELILFSFYWANRRQYHHALDIGANIGLHTIILSRCDLRVTAFEPDPRHFATLECNVALNRCKNARLVQAAVSDTRKKKAQFIRVLDNTTGSHLAGSKQNPYGPLETLIVNVESIADHLADVDLIKLDAEGQECEIINAMPVNHWRKTDAVVEVSSAANAHAIFEYLNSHRIDMFVQKRGWERAARASDLPVSHHEGMMFVTTKDAMPWPE